MCWISRSFPSRNLIFNFLFGGFSHSHGSFPHIEHTSCGFSQMQGICPQTRQTHEGFTSQTQGFCPHLEQISSIGSPSHSGSGPRSQIHRRNQWTSTQGRGRQTFTDPNNSNRNRRLNNILWTQHLTVTLRGWLSPVRSGKNCSYARNRRIFAWILPASCRTLSFRGGCGRVASE